MKMKGNRATHIKTMSYLGLFVSLLFVVFFLAVNFPKVIGVLVVVGVTIAILAVIYKVIYEHIDGQ